MNLDNIISRINHIETEQKYYFVRTDGGDNYETFVEHSFIGIGWNYISVEEIQRQDPNRTKRRISAELLRLANEEDSDNDFDPNSAKAKSAVTGIYNKIWRFHTLQQGDLIIIPSTSSSRLSFGIINDETTFTELIGSNDCNYAKRRSVNWVKHSSIDDLDPTFYKIVTPRHSISSINEKDYHKIIDNATNNIYIKDGRANIVFDVETNDEINTHVLLELLNSLQTLSSRIDSYFDFKENVSSNTIKISLNSKGKFVYGLSIKNAAMLSAILVLSGCDTNEVNLTQEDKEAIISIEKEFEPRINSIRETMDDLEIDINKLNAYK